jgi:hypothetical protein
MMIVHRMLMRLAPVVNAIGSASAHDRAFHH